MRYGPATGEIFLRAAVQGCSSGLQFMRLTEVELLKGSIL
jgi:hypothetical protein